MFPSQKWFERKFEFDLSVWMFPNVVERLRGTPARLAERVAGLRPEVLTRRDGEQWSIQEHVGHLGDLEPIHFKRMQDFLSGVELLTPADLSNRRTYEANHNAADLATLLEFFRRSRLQLVQLLDNIGEEQAQLTALHPRLKTPMRLIDSNFFWAEHDDHHLAIITSLIKKF